MVDAVDHGLNSGSGRADADTMLRLDAAELTPTKMQTRTDTRHTNPS